MPPFTLAPETVPLLCQALVLGIAGAYVLSVRRKTRSARWLAVLLGGNALFAVAFMLTMATNPDAWALRFNLALYVGTAVAGLGAVGLAYTFLARPFRREERRVVGAAAVGLAALVGAAAWLATGRGLERFDDLLTAIGAYLVATSGWAVVVSVRQSRRFRREADGARAHARAAAATAHRTLAALMGLMLLLAAVNGLVVVDVLPVSVIQSASLLVELVLAVGLIVVFINHAPEPTTVHAKVVGVSLGGVLAIVGVTSLLVLRPAELAADAGNAVPAAITVRFAPTADGGYRVERAPAADRMDAAGAAEAEGPVALPFGFAVGGRTAREVRVGRFASLSFGAAPCGEVCLGTAAAPAPDAPVVLPFLVQAASRQAPPVVAASAERFDAWWRTVGFGGEVSTHRATLFPDGAVEIAYRGPAQHPRGGSAGLHLSGEVVRTVAFGGPLPDRVAAGVGLVDPYGARFAAITARRTGRLLPVVLGATAFVLVLVPLFLQRGVLRPLGALLEGVERIDRGERAVRLAAASNDELGTLARRFNRMSASLGSAETRLREYAEGLEVRVAERTAALRDANAELEASLDELRATQGRLVQAEKLASLGRVTAGIAHEIKNPLNFVTNFAGLSREAVDELEAALRDGDADLAAELLGDLRSNAEKIEAHGQRADRIVRGMMLHARGDGGDRAPADLNGLLRLAAEGAARRHALRAGDDARAPIALDLDDRVGEVPVVAEGVAQVAASLLDNALHATADAGATAPVRLKSRRLDGVVEVTVADAGPGMDAETAGRVFEPFFTTRPPGEGTGLGLSLAYDIVTQGHGGEIALETRPGAGATFTVRLPTEA